MGGIVLDIESKFNCHSACDNNWHRKCIGELSLCCFVTSSRSVSDSILKYLKRSIGVFG